MLDDAEALLDEASALYEGDSAALAAIDSLRRRLHEPMRLALAGMVKAGKSTLLNAMLGEQIAPTDAGECTKVVTWYRYSLTPSIMVNLKDAAPRRMPIHRDEGRLVFDLGDLPAEEVESIEVGWPLEALKTMILIDTPGIGSLSTDISARTSTFLTPERSPTDADAIVYLMRHVHAADVAFLEAFRDTASEHAATTCAAAVLSRADEIGSGRIDSLLSAAKVARRYEADASLAALVLGVVPVAGLLAEGARTLREREYLVFRLLADLERDARESLLISADRFLGSDAIDLTRAERSALLERFGLFGIRMAAALVRAGADSSSALSDELVQQSGLIPLQEFVETQFSGRADVLKARGVLVGLSALLADRPRAGDEAVAAGIERIEAAAHGLRELSLVAEARAGRVPLPPAQLEVAMRIVGAEGTAIPTRLGLDDDEPEPALLARARELVAQWRLMADSPLLDGPALAACRVVERSLDGVISEISSGGLLRPAPDVVPAG